MGVYANWIEDEVYRRVGGPRGGWSFRAAAALAKSLAPLRLVPERTLLLAGFEPTRDDLLSTLGGLPTRIVLPFPPRQPIAGVRYARYLPSTNPLEWDAELDACIPEPIDSLATFLNWRQVHGKTLRAWRARGLQRLWFLHEDR